MTIPNTIEWREFLDKFREKSVLWQIKNENYKNRYLRAKAWNELLEEYKKIEKDITVDGLKRKITNIRSCYRRERKKLNASEKSGIGVDEIYVPTLWYFDAVDFLKDQETPLEGTSTIDNSDPEIDVSTEPIEATRTNTGGSHRNKQINRDIFLRRAVDYLESTKSTESTERDEATIFAEGWACTFRKLNVEQQIFAKKLIDETLLLGQLNKLEFSNKISTAATIISRPSNTSTPYITSRSSTPLMYSDQTSQNFRQRSFIFSEDSNTASPTLFNSPSTTPEKFKQTIPILKISNIKKTLPEKPYFYSKTVPAQKTIPSSISTPPLNSGSTTETDPHKFNLSHHDEMPSEPPTIQYENLYDLFNDDQYI